MGYSEKAHQVVDGGLESEGNNKKWVIVGIPIRAPLRKIRTKRIEKKEVAKEVDDECSTTTPTTPTSEEAKIPEIFSCPPAPRKRRPASRCNFNGVREFFTPPDLDSVFIRHVERAK